MLKMMNNSLGSYYIWTIGCQMNKADSERLGSAMQQMGLDIVDDPKSADVIVLNSCVVRQSAEDKVSSMIGVVRPLKVERSDRVVALMGCMVGPKHDDLKKRFPYIDVFMRPQQYEPLLDIIGDRNGLNWEGCVGTLAPPDPQISSYIPIIHGCDLMCSFCIIPYRRGRQISRSMEEIVNEVEMLVDRGVKEVTLLGQTVDAYGHDLVDRSNLSNLLRRVNDVHGLERIRFLTSHPIFMTDDIIEAVAGLNKVCEHVNLPIQAGDDDVLLRMRRRYTASEYYALIDKIRNGIPGVALSTDVIVGFSNETEEEFQRTVKVLTDVEFDKVHISKYSTRPGTIASRKMIDNVSDAEKKQRKAVLEQVQEKIQREKNATLKGQTVEVLVEDSSKGKWRGRTRGDKLTFIDDDHIVPGSVLNVEITETSPWSLQGRHAVQNTEVA